MKRKKKPLLGLAGLMALAFVAFFIFLSPFKAPSHKALPSIKVPVVTLEEPRVPFIMALPSDEALIEEEYPVVETPVVPSVEPSAPMAYKKKKIALVIDDMGINSAASARAIRLPAPITLSFLPYASFVRDQAQKARAAGHEILLHLPMEAMRGQNPGPGSLLVGQTPEIIEARLVAALAAFEGYDGINNHMGSRFTSEPEAMRVVLRQLKQRGLFFLDSRTSSQTIAEKMAREEGIPAAGRDVFLDDPSTAGAVRAQLEKAEQIAARRGSAIAIGHPHTLTLQAIETWLPEAEKRGTEIVPLKELIAP